MKYAIGRLRDIVLTRNKTTGEWSGEGHGYHILVKPKYGRVLYGHRWRCRVTRTELPYKAVLAVCEGHTIKWTVGEAVRIADRELEIRGIPIKHVLGCSCEDCEAFREKYNVAHGT